MNLFYLVLYLTVVVLYSVISLFIPASAARAGAVMTIVYVMVSATLIFIIFFRMFSRNISKRRRENDAFCGFFKLNRNRLRDRKTHVYRKCPHCRAVLRLPKAKGKHSVVCPRCHQRFRVRG